LANRSEAFELLASLVKELAVKFLAWVDVDKLKYKRATRNDPGATREEVFANNSFKH
jgi:hypothetical protein